MFVNLNIMAHSQYIRSTIDVPYHAIFRKRDFCEPKNELTGCISGLTAMYLECITSSAVLIKKCKLQIVSPLTTNFPGTDF